MTAAATPFDQLAATYDTAWTRSAIGTSQRLAVWRRIDPLFEKDERILDLGCGTGEDALHLQSRGVETYAIDSSAEMIRAARARQVNAHNFRIENIAEMSGEFNGAISNFGALNCVDDLEKIGCGLARVVRPGGYVAICLMGPFCAWETIYFVFRGNYRKAFRRVMRGKAPSSIGIDVSYPSRRDLERKFRHDFELIGWQGIGVCVPPSYAATFSRKTIAWLSQIDKRIAHWPFFRGLADHCLFIFKRL